MDWHFVRRSMRRRHRKQHGAQVRHRIRQDNRIRGKMLPHRLRRIRLDAGMIERETVECASRDTEGNRENGEQHYDMPTRKPALFATKIGFHPHYF